MALKIKEFTVDHFIQYSEWFKHRTIASALGYIDQEWLDFVLGTDGFKQISCFDHDKLLAVCGIYLPNKGFNYYAISDFAVHPSYQNHGYSSKFLNEIIYNQLFNESDNWKALIALDNHAAINFFERNGWKFEKKSRK